MSRFARNCPGPVHSAGQPPSRRMKKTGPAAFFLLAICLVLLFAASGHPQNQAAANEKAKPSVTGAQAQPQAAPEIIVPGPRNIRERIGIFVFVAWLWAAIVILVFILRLEIREADRVHKLKLYPGEHK